MWPDPIRFPKAILRLLCCAGLLAAGSGCTTVKPHQRAYLNDHYMQSGKTDIERFDESAHTYREGSSGGGSGKSSGGCGCN